MQTRHLSRAYQVLVSLFVGIALIIQASLVAQAAAGKIGGPRLWPFINYAMYDDPHHEGETINAYYLIEGKRADGTVVEIPREALRMSIWHYIKLGRDLKDGRPAAIALLQQKYSGPEPLVEIQVKSLPYVLTRNGRADAKSVVLKSIPLDRDMSTQARVAKKGDQPVVD